LGAGFGRAEGRPKKYQPLSMVTLIMSKFSLVGAESKRVKLGTPVRYRADAALRAPLKGRSKLVDAFAAIIKEIQASGVTSLRGIARVLAARGVKTARGGDWSDVQVAAVLRR
jgi:hypothetical protein